MARCGAMLRWPSGESMRRRCRSAGSVCGPFAFAEVWRRRETVPMQSVRESRPVVGLVLFRPLSGRFLRVFVVRRSTVSKRSRARQIKSAHPHTHSTHFTVLSSRVWSRLLLNVDGRSTPAWLASSGRRAEMVPASELRAWPTGSAMQDLGCRLDDVMSVGVRACRMCHILASEVGAARHGYACIPRTSGPSSPLQLLHGPCRGLGESAVSGM